MKIVTADQMRELERRAEAAGVSTDTLMEKAGLAAAEQARAFLGGDVRGQRVVVLIGPGNNGGDGLVTARHLAAWGAIATAYLCAPRKEPDPKLELARKQKVAIEVAWDDLGLATLASAFRGARLVIDAILGTGRARPIQGHLHKVLSHVRAARAVHPLLALLALDLPTGLNCDTGEVDPACAPADITVTLGNPKPGLFAFPGAGHVGRLKIVDIGIPPGLDRDVSLELITRGWVRSVLPARPRNAHKGTFGKALVIAGSDRYIGAAHLASAAVCRIGAGLVTLACPAGITTAIAARAPEVTYLPLAETVLGVLASQASTAVLPVLHDYDALLVGCGLGQRDAAAELVRDVLLSQGASSLRGIVIDADGLNNLAKLPDWGRRLPAGKCVVTPHPGEMSRLLKAAIQDVERDRVATADKAAREWGQTVVLKGPFTVIASPDGKQRLSPFAEPALATAGTGDVLAGAIVGLLAQGLAPFDAAAAGVYLHGLAGRMVGEELGDTGATASDLLPTLPRAVRLVKQTSRST
ncbi:MAG: NAD(P)H-hydrate dehydratase [Chloroflexi bacterium]|nr:NAD(P)H-hydrate dehydratase [Chloroflexota bacterium]